MPSESRESFHPQDIEYVRANVPCQAACPALTNVPAYIQAIGEGDYNRAYGINRVSNVLPGVLSRICTRPCQNVCRRGDPDLGKAVEICHLKRFACDFKTAGVQPELPQWKLPKLSQTQKTVGIVGAGPAGLAAGDLLARFGHTVTLYESMPKPGGMLIYGIPPFRLPREIVAEEISAIVRLGVTIECNVAVGKDLTLDQLLKKHDAVLIATGCPLPKKIGMEGEERQGFYTGLRYLVDVHRGEPPPIGKRVVVFGGGFTAVDCVRTARRQGAKEVTLCIRRTEEKLPVSKEEIEETRREGIEIIRLVTPVQILGNGRDSVPSVKGVKFRRNQLVLKPGSKRETPVMIEGSDFDIEADTVIGAIGQEADLSIKVSQRPGLFAAGDFVHGATSVIEAIGDARRTAVQIDAFLTGQTRLEQCVTIEPAADTPRQRSWDFIPPTPMPMLDLEKRGIGKDSGEQEVETGYTLNSGQEEAKRCYLCQLKYEIDISHCIYCTWCVELCPRDCIEMTSDIRGGQIVPTKNWNEVAGIVIDNSRCIRCGECLRVCPTQCIHVWRVNLVERLKT